MLIFIIFHTDPDVIMALVYSTDFCIESSLILSSNLVPVLLSRVAPAT
jgi:hypothetical protein